MGVDGSPTCGVEQTIDIGKAADRLASLSIGEITVDQVNAVVQQSVRPGQGLFIQGLRDELRCRHLDVTFAGHDLLAELRGEKVMPASEDAAKSAFRP